MECMDMLIRSNRHRDKREGTNPHSKSANFKADGVNERQDQAMNTFYEKVKSKLTTGLDFDAQPIEQYLPTGLASRLLKFLLNICRISSSF